MAGRLISDPNLSADLTSFMARLRDRRVSGAEARRAIVERLAGMSLKELREVSPAVFARLGPSGLADLAERSTILNAPALGLAQVTERSSKRFTIQQNQLDRTVFARWQKSQPLPWEVVKEAIVMTVVVSFLALASPLLWRIATQLPRTDQLAPCRQLDRLTGNCTYVVGSNRLTIEAVASLLDFPLRTIVGVNPAMSRGPLRAGSRLIIPRRPWLNLR